MYKKIEPFFKRIKYDMNFASNHFLTHLTGKIQRRIRGKGNGNPRNTAANPTRQNPKIDLERPAPRSSGTHRCFRDQPFFGD